MNKIKTSEPKPLWKLRCTLGEGTLWVSEHNSIYFVDIKKKKICSFNIKNKKKKTFKVNKENISLSVSKNPILVTALNREIGYEKAALIAKKAYKENRSVIEVAHEITGIQIKKLKSILNPANLTKGGLK